MEGERLGELYRRVERECVEAETEEVERQRVLERLDVALARGQEMSTRGRMRKLPCGASEVQETLRDAR